MSSTNLSYRSSVHGILRWTHMSFTMCVNRCTPFQNLHVNSLWTSAFDPVDMTSQWTGFMSQFICVSRALVVFLWICAYHEARVRRSKSVIVKSVCVSIALSYSNWFLFSDVRLLFECIAFHLGCCWPTGLVAEFTTIMEDKSTSTALLLMNRPFIQSSSPTDRKAVSIRFATISRLFRRPWWDASPRIKRRVI